jgi:hypothetical protein
MRTDVEDADEPSGVEDDPELTASNFVSNRTLRSFCSSDTVSFDSSGHSPHKPIIGLSSQLVCASRVRARSEKSRSDG